MREIRSSGLMRGGRLLRRPPTLPTTTPRAADARLGGANVVRARPATARLAAPAPPAAPSRVCHGGCFLLRGWNAAPCGRVQPHRRRPARCSGPRGRRRSCRPAPSPSFLRSTSLRFVTSAPAESDRWGPRCAHRAAAKRLNRRTSCGRRLRFGPRGGSASRSLALGPRLGSLRLRFGRLGRVRLARRSRCPRARPGEPGARCARSPTPARPPRLRRC